MENRLDACENRWLRRIRHMRITCKVRITNETIRQRTTGTSVQPDQTDVIKMAWACVTDEGRPTDSVHQWYSTGKRSRGRPNKRWMDCIEEYLWRAGVTECGKTAGRQWMTLNDIAAVRQQWRNLTAASMAEICWTLIIWPTVTLQCLLQLHN